jgi:hypothetical protein
MIPDLSVTLTPYNLPIQIPASGGSFDFNIAVANDELAPFTFDFWTMATLPNGTVYGPITFVPEFTIDPGVTLDRDRTQNVPVSALAGDYSYDAYLGTYPDYFITQDHFGFSKLTTNSGQAIIDDWNCLGKAFGQPESSSERYVPDRFRVHKPYPNPFNAEAIISFDLPDERRMSISIFNITGQRVAQVMDGWRKAGTHTVTFDAKHLPSGIYFCKLTAGNKSSIAKLLLIK